MASLFGRLNFQQSILVNIPVQTLRVLVKLIFLAIVKMLSINWFPSRRADFG